LKERGVIRNTATAVEETTLAAKDKVQTAKDTIREAAEGAPHTTEAVRKGAKTVTTEPEAFYAMDE
jgi:hypothetical protein